MATQRQDKIHAEPLLVEDRDRLIDKWIEIAGPLPDKEFEIEKLEAGERVRVAGTARDKLHSMIRLAHIRYRFGDERQLLDQKKEWVAELRRIEGAAEKLSRFVAAVEGYEHPLHDVIRHELEAVRRATSLPIGLSALSLTPHRQLRTILEAVHALHRWSRAAREDHEQRIQRKAKYLAAGHRGNVALNRFVETVLEECWSGVWGRRLADGPVLWHFVMAGAAAIGARLSEDASRDRIRRVLGRRRANQKHPSRKVPDAGPVLQGQKLATAKHSRSS